VLAIACSLNLRRFPAVNEPLRLSGADTGLSGGLLYDGILQHLTAIA
jgi:hypothetical protein